MELIQKAVGLGVLGLVAWAVLSRYQQQPGIIKDQNVVPQAPSALQWHGGSTFDEVSDVDIRPHGRPGPVLHLALGDDGLLYQTPQQAESGAYDIVQTPKLYLYRTGFDIGAFAGAGNVDGRLHAELGVRYSPIRLGFNVIAPDLVISNDAVGAGISLYPPARSVGYPWCRLGIGAWYMVPLDGSRPGTVLGITSAFH